MMFLGNHTLKLSNRVRNLTDISLPTGNAAPRRLALGAISFMMMLFALIPAFAVGAASPYPANTVVSSYFDPRYCGNGAVSVVSDAGGNLIDVCTSTGVRITPVYPDYAPVIGYTAPVYMGVSSYAYTPAISNTVSSAYAYSTSAYADGTVAYGSRQYTDTRTNCPNGDVTQTGATYVCTATGTPAVVVG